MKLTISETLTSSDWLYRWRNDSSDCFDPATNIDFSARTRFRLLIFVIIIRHEPLRVDIYRVSLHPDVSGINVLYI